MITLLKAPTTIAILILLSLLCASIAVNKSQSNQLRDLEKEIAVSSATNVRLNETIVSMQEELNKRPTQLVEITKDVYKELCYGEGIEGQILSLPPIVVKDVPEDKEATQNVQKSEFVDIDGLLPEHLKRLLQ